MLRTPQTFRHLAEDAFASPLLALARSFIRFAGATATRGHPESSYLAIPQRDPDRQEQDTTMQPPLCTRPQARSGSHDQPHDWSLARASKLGDENRLCWHARTSPPLSFDSRLSLRVSSLSIPYYDARSKPLGWIISAKDFQPANGRSIVRDADTPVIFPRLSRLECGLEFYGGNRCPKCVLRY